MLKDRYFYPLAIACIIGMVFYAMSKADYEDLTKNMVFENGFIINGEDLATLTASPGTLYNYTATTSSEQAFVTLRTNVPREKTIPSAGVFAALGEIYEATFATQNLKMTIRARQGRTDPLTHFDMGYFTADVGDSGWVRQSLTPQWKDYSLEFTPNSPVNDLGVDYAGIWPGDKGKNETMDVQFIKIDILSKTDAEP